MNVYDFDGTIYKKDSSVELYKFVIKKNPIILFQCLPRQAWAILKYKLKLLTKEQMKEIYFSFLKYTSEEKIDLFVEKEMANINSWYIEKKKDTDIIISASPQFLVEKFAKKLGIQSVIATGVDINSGKFLTKNCHDKEKVNRFKLQFPNGKIDDFYSDSKTDVYLAKLAKNAYRVAKNKLEKWEI